MFLKDIVKQLNLIIRTFIWYVFSFSFSVEGVRLRSDLIVSEYGILCILVTVLTLSPLLTTNMPYANSFDPDKTPSNFSYYYVLYMIFFKYWRL